MKDEVKNSYFSQGTEKRKKQTRKRQNQTTELLLELIVVHYLMFYDQQFRLGLTNTTYPKQSAVSAKAEVACEISGVKLY